MKNKILIIIASIFLLVGCWFLWNQQEPRKTKELKVVAVPADNPYSNADIKAVIIPSEKNTFGYDIYVYGAVLVHQPSRPGLPGNTGFATAENARKVAELVIKKIRNNELPPTVTIEELKELRVLTN